MPKETRGGLLNEFHHKVKQGSHQQILVLNNGASTRAHVASFTSRTNILGVTVTHQIATEWLFGILMMSVHVKTTLSFAPAPRNRASPCIRNQGIHKAIQLDDKTFGQFSAYVDQDLGRAPPKKLSFLHFVGRHGIQSSAILSHKVFNYLTSTTGHGNGSIPDVTHRATFLCLPVNLGKLLRVKSGGEERAISGEHTNGERPGS